MATPKNGVVTIKGRRLALGADGQLQANGIDISRPCVDASITVSAEGATVANRRDITVQLKDADGNDIDYVEVVELLVTPTADLTNLAAPAPSTGLAIGTDGALMAIKAHNLYYASCEADGDIDLTWTDTGTAAAFLHVRLPNGRIVTSSALTNA